MPTTRGFGWAPRRAPGLVVFCALLLVVPWLSACGDDSAGGEEPRAEVAALVDGIAFEGGELVSGAIPPADTTMRLAPVRPGDRVHHLLPGDDLVMQLMVQDPEQPDDDAIATLLQFEGTSSHVRVEHDEPVTEMEIRGTVTDDLCASLCDTLYEMQLLVAPELPNGRVGRQVPIDLFLDCSASGNDALCTGAEPVVSVPGETQTAGGAPDAGAPDAATSEQDAAVSEPDAAVTDAGERDAGEQDAGQRDAAAADAGGQDAAVTDAGAQDAAPANQRPVASAGSDTTVAEGTRVELSGSASDADGSVASQGFEQRGGPVVTLSGSGNAASFTAPAVGTPTVLFFAFVVTDDDGARSEDFVVVTVTPVNAAPSVSAGSDRSVSEGDAVTITATASDSDGTLAGIVWQQLGGPVVTLGGGTTLSVDFTAPITTLATAIVLEIAVTDDEGARSTDIVVVEVLPINAPPMAGAGDDQTVDGATLVQLLGSASDSDGSVASTRWRQLFGTTVTLDDATALDPTFTAPDVLVPQTLRFELVVTDDEGGQATDMVDVVVSPPALSNIPPLAYAGPDQAVGPGSTVNLAGVESDQDGTIAVRGWTQVSGTSVSIVNGDTLAASFMAPSVACAESLVFELRVEDEDGAVDTDRVAITVAQNLTGAPSVPVSLDLEADDGGFITGGSLWQHGVPTTGPLRAHSGTRVWATNLTGNYTDNASEWLCLPPVDRSAVADATLSFRLWSTIVSGDGLRLQALDPDAGWTDINAVTPAYDAVAGWHDHGYQNQFQLVAATVPGWAGEVAQLRLLFSSNGGGTQTGAYVDDFRVDDEGGDPDGDGLDGVLAELGAYGTDPFVSDSDGDGESDGDEVAAGANPLVPASDSSTTPLSSPVVLDFDASDGGLATDGTLWAHGAPIGGPGRAHSGGNVWATNPSGNYFDNAREYLYLPPIDLTAGGAATLSFRLWARTVAGDGTSLEYLEGGAWRPLPNVLPAYDGTDAIGQAAWVQQRYQNEYRLVAVDLSALSARIAALRFAFRSNAGATQSGAYIDDVRVDLESSDPDADGIAGVMGELTSAGTDPFVADSDGDGESDGDEVSAGSDPLDPAQRSTTLALMPGDHLDFFLDDGGLATDGTLWQHGDVASGPFGGYGDSRVWATDLSGHYFDDAREFLYLPPIDLTTASDPTLSLRVWSRCVVPDGASLEIYDDVLGWVGLAVQAGDYDGTDPIGRPAWQSQGYRDAFEYVLAAASLSSYVGEAVQVRVAFRSNGGATQDGVYLDDLRIDEEADDPDGDGIAGVLGELIGYGTDPYVADTDGDGENDGAEDLGGSDPLNPAMRSDTVALSPGARLTFDAGDDGGLATRGTLWQHGDVASGPGVAYSGNQLWATNLGGNYFDDAREYLYLPPIDLTGGGGDATLSVRMWARHINPDGMALEVWDGSEWIGLPAQAPAYDGVDAVGVQAFQQHGYRSEYVLLAASLAAYDGQTPRVRLSIRTNGGATHAGAYIDDMRVDLESADPDGDGLAGVLGELLVHGTDPYVADSDGDGVNDGTEVSSDFTEPLVGSDHASVTPWTPGDGADLESDDGGLWTDRSLWAYGPPASGPGVAHSGSRVWATYLGGNYFDDAREYLHLPPFDLSAASAPELVLQLWCDNLGSDGVSVEVLDDVIGWAHLATVTPAYNGTDGIGNACFQDVGSGSSYQEVRVDLSAWSGAGHGRRLFRFAYRSNGGATTAGCYLDDLSLVDL